MRASPTLADLIRYTNGHWDVDEYLRSGREVATMLDLALRKHFDKGISGAGTTLDFGCGSGRIGLFVSPAVLHGCDVNSQVIDYCQAHMPWGHWLHSPLLPPLPYGDGMFDLVYSFSVFSHLALDVEQAWLAELARIGHADTVYLISVQGDWMIEATLREDAAAASSSGFYYRKVHKRYFGANLDFPEYYESSYHTSKWIKEHWSRWFDVHEIIKGDDPARYVHDGDSPPQELYGASLRPMGQDLVVMTKRVDREAATTRSDVVVGEDPL